MSNDDPPSIKVTLLGNPGVGKTCIIARYIDNTFDENNAPTIGANYSEKIIKKGNKEYELNIWDTAGQEKFHSLGKHFYKESYIVCLVYDITSQESLDHLKTIWYPDLQKYGEKYTILAVVGNKSDLYEGDKLADEAQAKAFADEIGATFQLTSAKSGDGIEKLFNTLTDRFLSPEFNPKLEEMLKIKGGNIQTLKQEQNEGKKKKKGFC
jgi:small GTP-binding protein